MGKEWTDRRRRRWIIAMLILLFLGQCTPATAQLIVLWMESR